MTARKDGLTGGNRPLTGEQRPTLTTNSGVKTCTFHDGQEHKQNRDSRERPAPSPANPGGPTKKEPQP